MTHDRNADETMTELEENSLTLRGTAIGVLPAQRPPFADVEAARWPLDPASPVARWSRWCLQGGVSILQQGLFAGAHFAVNILLARWLSPSSYGVFALAYSLYLLLLAFYMATFYDPVLIFGPGRYYTNFAPYIRTLARAHFIFLPPVCFVAALAGMLLAPAGASEIRWALIAVAAAAPLLLFIWLCRAAFYARLQVWQGTTAGGFYVAFLIGFVCILHRWGMLSSSSALLAMAIGSLLVGAGAFSGFLYAGAPDGARLKLNLSEVAGDHWRYGKWAALTAVAAWFPVNIYYTLLPPRFGMESAAALRALMNLMYPLLHALLSLVSILVPTLVKRRHALGLGAMCGTVWKLASLFLPAGIAYLCVLAGLREPILHLLYGNRYANQSIWAVLCLGTLPITTGIAYVLAAGLRALEAPQLIFYSYLAALATTAVVGVPLALRWGIAGAAGGMVASDVPTIAVLAFCLARAGMAPK